MNLCEITSSVTAAANALSCRMSDEELTLLASVLVQLGDTLVTIVILRSITKKKTAIVTETKAKKTVGSDCLLTLYLQ